MRIGKLRYNSPLILTFALLSLAALGLDKVTGGVSNALCFSVYRSSPLSPFFWVRLFGHVLGHGSYAHWSGNMMMFLLIGPMLEEKYGTKRLLGMFAAVAAATGAIQILLFPHTALMGASGIVFMMIILSSAVSVKKGEIPLTILLIAVLYLGREFYGAIFLRDQTSQLTHIVGGVIGGLFGLRIL